jgi:sugar O-acyltransferase (sialic acid O-acetyltransferase NeuD family)
MPDLVVFGSGGFGREALEVAWYQGSWNILGFLNDQEDTHGAEINGYAVLGGLPWLAAHPDVSVAVAIGDPRGKADIAQKISAIGHSRFGTLIHPDNWIGRLVEIGPGCIICAGVRITTNVRIGAHVILNLDVTVGHDCEIGDYATASPGANISGSVRVGEGAYIGTNAAVLEKRVVGAWSVIAAGAAVIRDVPPGAMVAGVPAAEKKAPGGPPPPTPTTLPPEAQWNPPFGAYQPARDPGSPKDPQGRP